MVSRVFPKTHPRKGEDTFFKQKIQMCFQQSYEGFVFDGKVGKMVTFEPAPLLEREYKVWPGGTSQYPKLHTIRSNYDLWKKRADKINAGEAVLSLRQWTGSPYNFARDGSKPVEFMQLEKVGVERVSLKIFIGQVIGDVQASVNGWTLKEPAKLIKNDGLSVSDFAHWFKKDFDGVIIHFTDFRYGNS